MRTPPLSAVFSPRVSLPLSFTSPADREAGVLVGDAGGALLELLAVLLRPPVGAGCPWRSNFRPWSSKPWVSSWPMTAPMPPKFTASSIALSKNGGCRMPAGKLMLFSKRVVVRVDGGRRHAPLRGIDRLADLVAVARLLEGGGAARVAEGVAADDADRGVVAPVLGVPDLVGDGGELLQRLLLGGLRHPGQAADVLLERLLEGGHHLRASAPCPPRRTSPRRSAGRAPRRGRRPWTGRSASTAAAAPWPR